MMPRTCGSAQPCPSIHTAVDDGEASHRAQIAGAGIANAAGKHKELMRSDTARCWLGAGQDRRAGAGFQKLQPRGLRCMKAQQSQRGLRDDGKDGVGDRRGGAAHETGASKPRSAAVVLGLVSVGRIGSDREDPQGLVLENQRFQAHATVVCDRLLLWHKCMSHTSWSGVVGRWQSPEGVLSYCLCRAIHIRRQARLTWRDGPALLLVRTHGFSNQNRPRAVHRVICEHSPLANTQRQANTKSSRDMASGT